MVERELDYTEYHLSDLTRTRINFWWKKNSVENFLKNAFVCTEAKLYF